MSVEEIREVNKYTEEYLKNHKPSYGFKDFPVRNANMVVACMDPRCNPTEFWGFTEISPKAVVLRNAGGRVTEDVLRSIRVASSILGYGKSTVGAVAVVHHVDCGMTHFRDEKIGQLLAEHAGLEGERAKEAAELKFGEIPDMEASVWEDMKKIKADPYLPKEIGVIGYVWDSVNNKMTELGTL